MAAITQVLNKGINFATKYIDDFGFGVRNYIKPDNLKGLRILPDIIGDTFSSTKKCLSEQLQKSTKTTVKFSNNGTFNLARKSKEFQELTEEMDLSLECISDSKLISAIKKSGDYFSGEELCNIDYLVGQTDENLDDILACRGNLARLGITKDKIKPKTLEEIKHMIKDYVNKLSVFKTFDKSANYEYTKQINAFINSQSKYLADDVLYRGELSEHEINRLLSLIIKKQKNPTQAITYSPGHLLSTTNNLRSLTDLYDYADKCFIKIIGTKGACKGVDVNDLLKSQNKFFNQSEILLPSTANFEVIEGFVENGRLFVTLKFLS